MFRYFFHIIALTFCVYYFTVYVKAHTRTKLRRSFNHAHVSVNGLPWIRSSGVCDTAIAIWRQTMN